MKDSGVEWIGEIPSHWVLSKVMYVLEFNNNVRIPLSSEDRGKRQGEYRYYGSTGIIDYIDDGYEIQMNNGLIKTDKFDLYKEELYKRINEINNKTNKLIIDDDWHIEKKELILDINKDISGIRNLYIVIKNIFIQFIIE